MKLCTCRASGNLFFRIPGHENILGNEMKRQIFELMYSFDVFEGFRTKSLW